MTEQEILTLKQTAAEKSGVPIELIQGETAEEIAAHAAALVTFKRQYAEAQPDTKPLTTREQFAEWLNNVSDNGVTIAEPTAEPAPAESGGYPIVPDGGTPQNIEYERDPRDAFREWFGNVSAFDPRKDYGNW